MKDGGLAEFLRFGVASGANLVFGFAAYASLVLAGLAVPLALLVATIVGVFFNFFTFGSYAFRKLEARRLPQFLLAYGFIYIVNLILLEGIRHWTGLGPIVAQLVALVLVAPAAYLLLRSLVFHDDPRPAAHDLPTGGGGTLKRFAYWLLNIPPIWIAFQYCVGANQWKSRMYPSVFATRGALLDFGCSMGNNTGDFLDFDYTGLDLDASKIEAARSRWAGRANVRFECGDILVMPERKARFDHVLFASVGHHLSDEQMPLVIEALLGTLRPGGELHFFDPLNQPGKDRFTTRLIMRNDQGKFMRTVQQYDAMFAPYPVVERRIFPSPDGKPVKLQDMLYLRLRKDAA